MRWLKILLLLVMMGAPRFAAQAAEAAIVKVLPHFLDAQGRHTLAPSLYERDAYQAQLRKHPEQRSALRFDIQWKARPGGADPLKLRLEIRGSKAGLDKPLVLEQAVKAPSGFSRWSSLTLAGETFKQCGEVTGWRATLWQGDRQLAEQKSFLW